MAICLEQRQVECEHKSSADKMTIDWKLWKRDSLADWRWPMVGTLEWLRNGRQCSVSSLLFNCLVSTFFPPPASLIAYLPWLALIISISLHFCDPWQCLFLSFVSNLDIEYTQHFFSLPRCSVNCVFAFLLSQRFVSRLFRQTLQLLSANWFDAIPKERFELMHTSVSGHYWFGHYLSMTYAPFQCMQLTIVLHFFAYQI